VKKSDTKTRTAVKSQICTKCKGHKCSKIERRRVRYHVKISGGPHSQTHHISTEFAGFTLSILAVFESNLSVTSIGFVPLCFIADFIHVSTLRVCWFFYTLHTYTIVEISLMRVILFCCNT
jgi:hypothetical protein